jgi:hypothetical protein
MVRKSHRFSQIHGLFLALILCATDEKKACHGDNHNSKNEDDQT